MPTLRIVVNHSQGKAAVPYWAQYNYGVRKEQITKIKKVGGDGYHVTFEVTYEEDRDQALDKKDS